MGGGAACCAVLWPETDASRVLLSVELYLSLRCKLRTAVQPVWFASLTWHQQT